MAKRDVRWFVIGFGLVGLLASLHTWIIAGHSDFASGVVRGDLALDLPFQRIRQDFTTDGHMWIRHAIGLTEGDALRLRSTVIDNAPVGREVHWNSAYAWWLASCGKFRQIFFGESLTRATENAAMWANLPLLLLFSGGMGWWVFRRAGLAAGLVTMVAFFGHGSLYEGFWPGYVDHHGIVLAAVLGLALGAFFMRGGWVARGDEAARGAARSAARWSGFWGGVALWINAATAIPAIALVALAAVVATVTNRRELKAANAVCEGALWREWGRSGALTSVVFYLLEYFPSHLGWRLEVNHPLYALSWWAAAEWMAKGMPLWFGREQPASGAWRQLGATTRWTLPLVLAPLGAILLWGTKVFVLVDPFLVGLHRTITEFVPLLTRVSFEGILLHHDRVLLWPLLYLGAFLLGWWATKVDRWALVFALLTALPVHLMGLWQSRWAMNAAPGHILLLIVVAAALLDRTAGTASRGRRIVSVVALLLVFLGPALGLRLGAVWLTAPFSQISSGDARQLIYREVAQTIRNSQPVGEVVLFASPNTSVNVAFFGGFKTLGTLYWENIEGLKAAAALSAAQSESEAAALVRQHGVTHLVFLRAANYVAEYAVLLHPHYREKEVKQSFGYRLMYEREIPVWLEALPYAPPSGVPAGVDREVMVFRVNFEQRTADATYRLGLMQNSRKEFDQAFATFTETLRIDPQHSGAMLRRAELFFARQEWAAAVAEFDRAGALVPEHERQLFLTQVGVGFHQAKRYVEAVTYYDRAVAADPLNPVASNNLAWILATTRMESLFDGPRALALARANVERQPLRSAAWGTLAAAQAACGDFPAAVASLERAMDLLDRASNRAVFQQLEQQRESYRVGQVWLEQ